ncbi:MAG: Gfo/Idh/MocA family oxidoreductase [Anaerolineae bacterium]|nr:Gfo/Idh/MocA family oxidoreductase [Anaerolineae bacterium]
MSEMSKTYTVAIAGLGKRGTHHADAFAANPRFELVGLCDIAPERLADAAETYGVSYTNPDAAQMLADTRPDVFVFCTLPNLRLEFVRAGVQAGVQLIAYEKPMATSTNEALQIMKLLRDAGCKSVVSHQHRYGDHYKKVKEIVASGAIGRVHTIYGHASGWMLHMMTHLIDYVRWYNDNAEAEWVVGQAAGVAKFSDNHPSPDYIAGLIQFENGVRGIVECGEGAPDVPEVDYWWRKARVGAQGTEGFAEVLTGGGWRAITRDSNGVISGSGNMDYAHDMPPYVQQIADWLDDPAQVHPCNGESAFKGFEIMMAMCRSAVQRGQISLPLGPGDPELEALQAALS